MTNSPNTKPLPGNFDPAVAAQFGRVETAAEARAPPGSMLRQDLAHRAYAFTTQATYMQVGGKVPWWDIQPRSEKMSYDCDATLGTPAAVDCAYIQTHQLGTLNKTLEVGPMKTRLLSSSQ